MLRKLLWRRVWQAVLILRGRGSPVLVSRQFRIMQHIKAQNPALWQKESATHVDHHRVHLPTISPPALLDVVRLVHRAHELGEHSTPGHERDFAQHLVGSGGIRA
jgi:hypothetical protein